MSLSAVIDHAQAFEGRETATLATHRAIDRLGRDPVIFGLVIASSYFPIQQVLSGVSTLLGDVPLLGLSTSAELTSSGLNQRSVIVALLTSNDVNAQADWWSGFGEDSRRTTQRMAQTFDLDQAEGTLLLVADGLVGDGKQLCSALPPGGYSLAGCLSGGSLHQPRSFQIGGRQSGTGGLAAALLTGNLITGVGINHGWQSVGAYFRVTSAHGPLLYTLNDKPVPETYASLFGFQARDWTIPPLNELVRLYPLGIEQAKDSPLLLRAPLRMEAEGNLRMNTIIPESSTGHMMVGSTDNCLEAARRATQQALETIGKAQPVFALVFADISWQMLFRAQPGIEVDAIRYILGPQIPIIGGYTFGQIAHLDSKDANRRVPEFFNQHIEVVVFADKKPE